VASELPFLALKVEDNEQWPDNVTYGFYVFDLALTKTMSSLNQNMSFCSKYSQNTPFHLFFLVFWLELSH
jgi:hypothetical protein